MQCSKDRPLSLSVTTTRLHPQRSLRIQSKVQKCTIKGGIVDGVVTDAQGIDALADLPPREVLIARMLGSMMSPITGLAIALDQLAKKLGGGEAAEEAAAE